MTNVLAIADAGRCWRNYGRAAIGPLMAAQLLTVGQIIRANRVIGQPLRKRAGVHAARVGLAHRVAAMRPAPSRRVVDL